MGEEEQTNGRDGACAFTFLIPSTMLKKSFLGDQSVFLSLLLE